MPYTTDSRFINALLLNNVTANTAPVWFRLDGLHPITCTIEGVNSLFIATVRLYVSNHPIQPANGETGRAQLSQDYAQAAAFVIDASWKWIAAEVTAYVSGTIACALFGGS